MNYNQQNYAVKIFKLLSNANRLKIVNLVAAKKNGIIVSDIARILDLEMTTISNHLLRLRENGVVKGRQSGSIMSYKIKDLRTIEIIELAKKIA